MDIAERAAILVVSATDAHRLSGLITSVIEHGLVTAVDDKLDRITLQHGNDRVTFVVDGGNSLQVERTVMLWKVGGQLVLLEEPYGLLAIQSHLGEKVVDHFEAYGRCTRCVSDDHQRCMRQAGQGPCRCGCGVVWAVHRARRAASRPRPQVGAGASLATVVPIRPAPRVS